MRWVGGLVVITALGCLRAFGPDLRSAEHHAGLRPDSATCMDCHVSEAEAIAMGIDEAHPSSAPIVAPWMLEEDRPCVACHRVRSPRGQASAWRLDPVGPEVADVR